MKHSLWNKRIPSILGVILIILGIGLTTFLVKGGNLLQINATPSATPKNVQITNISDTSFTVTYMTDESVIGTINFGKDPKTLDQTVLDERDQLSQKINKYQAHSIAVNSLEPNTTYYFTITSSSEKIDNNASPFKVQTGPSISTTPASQVPMSGKVINPDASSPSDGIVLVTVNGGQKLSTVLKNDGSYTLPLNTMRTEDFSNYFSLSTDSIINIQVNSANLASFISVSPDQLSPVPVITLSNNYDFSNSEPTTTPQASSSANQPSEKFPEMKALNQKQDVSISIPKKEEKFIDAQPRFDGTGAPNTQVEIEIHSDEAIKAQVKTDANGKWTFRPTSPLSAGTHTITIITKDVSGTIKTVTQNFVIFASGSQIAQSATPSGIISPTKAPSNTPIPTKIPTKAPAKSPTPTPTKKLSPTPTIKLSPTPIPTVNNSPTPIPPVSVAPTLPPTGSPFAIMAGIGILAASFAAVALFLLTRKNML